MIDMKLIDELRRYAEQYQKPPTGREIDGTAELLIAAADALEKAQPQWIPVTERLPETSQDVLITRRNAWGTVRVMKAFYISSDDGGIWASQRGTDTSGVIAWMPLPEPYIPVGLEDPE